MEGEGTQSIHFTGGGFGGRIVLALQIPVHITGLCKALGVNIDNIACIVLNGIDLVIHINRGFHTAQKPHLTHIIYLSSFRKGHVHLYTLQAGLGVAVQGVAFNSFHIQGAGHQTTGAFVDVIHIPDHTLLVKGKTHHIQHVDLLDQLHIRYLQVYLLTAHRKADIIEAVRTGHTPGCTVFALTHILGAFHIPI